MIPIVSKNSENKVKRQGNGKILAYDSQWCSKYIKTDIPIEK